tara:strand:+ start:247 stop:807 length:561 start_codon:yes stop_codon:yes gene_type:complete
MRSLLLIIALLFTSCKVNVNNNISQVKFKKTYSQIEDYQKTLPFADLLLGNAILEQYAPNAKVYIVADQPLAYALSGLANQLEEHTYLIQISWESPSIKSTLFHELGHIIDAELGRLGFSPHSWEGDVIVWGNVKWQDRPWEQSAEMWRECLQYEYENELLTHYEYESEKFLQRLNLNPFKLIKGH